MWRSFAAMGVVGGALIVRILGDKARKYPLMKWKISMSFYEVTFIVRHDVSKPDVEKLADDFAEILKQGGGKVAKREIWGLRPLAYKINKHGKGNYVYLVIDAPHAALAEMERMMRLNEDVMRQLTVRIDAISEEPSAMMRKYEEREERGDRPQRGPRPDRDAA